MFNFLFIISLFWWNKILIDFISIKLTYYGIIYHYEGGQTINLGNSGRFYDFLVNLMVLLELINIFSIYLLNSIVTILGNNYVIIVTA